MYGEFPEHADMLTMGMADVWRGLAQLSLTLDDVQRILGDVAASAAVTREAPPSTERGAWLRAYA